MVLDECELDERTLKVAQTSVTDLHSFKADPDPVKLTNSYQDSNLCTYELRYLKNRDRKTPLDKS
jgi:hypothetical protein